VSTCDSGHIQASSESIIVGVCCHLYHIWVSTYIVNGHTSSASHFDSVRTKGWQSKPARHIGSQPPHPLNREWGKLSPANDQLIACADLDTGRACSKSHQKRWNEHLSFSVFSLCIQCLCVL